MLLRALQTNLPNNETSKPTISDFSERRLSSCGSCCSLSSLAHLAINTGELEDWTQWSGMDRRGGRGDHECRQLAVAQVSEKNRVVSREYQ
jgi:hypothetical protein